MTDIDISRERIERLHKIDCADYLHLALLDEVDSWRERCRNFEGKKELVARLNELLTINAELLAALEAMTDRFEETLAATHATRTDRQEIKEARAAIAKAKDGKG